MRFKIGIVILFAILGISILLFQEFSNSDTVYIGIIEESSALPFLDAYSKKMLGSKEYPVEIKIYQNENQMLFDATNGKLDAFYCEAANYLSSPKLLSKYIAVSSSNKELYLFTSNRHIEKTHLNEVKAGAIGIYNDMQCQLFIDSIIRSNNLIGVSIDEVLITDPIKRIKLLEDNTLDFAIFQSPYSDFLIEKKYKIMYKINETEPSMNFLVLKRELEDSHLEMFLEIINDLNLTISDGSVKNYNDLINEYFNMPTSIKLNDLSSINTFSPPNHDDIDALLSWLYKTNKIQSKYKFHDLFTDQMSPSK